MFFPSVGPGTRYCYQRQFTRNSCFASSSNVLIYKPFAWRPKAIYVVRWKRFSCKTLWDPALGEVFELSRNFNKSPTHAKLLSPFSMTVDNAVSTTISDHRLVFESLLSDGHLGRSSSTKEPFQRQFHSKQKYLVFPKEKSINDREMCSLPQTYNAEILTYSDYLKKITNVGNTVE